MTSTPTPEAGAPPKNLTPHGADLILSGHTHGGQIRLPFYGPPRLNVRDTHHDWGLFDLPQGGKLYVSSGVGYIRQIRFGSNGRQNDAPRV